MRPVNHTPWNRRQFLGVTTAAALAPAVAPLSLPAANPFTALTIIDTHTHYYDPTRPEGVPWPEKTSSLYRKVMPRDYKALRQPHAVAGTIVVEASPLVEDNQWILDLAQNEPFIVGFVGNLNPADANFLTHLERFAKNPILRGLRVRLPKQLSDGMGQGSFMVGLKRMAELDLTLDVGGAGNVLPHIPALVKKLPALRLVINHLAGVRVDGRPPDPEWVKAMREAAKGKNVYCKISGLVEGTGKRDGTAPRDTEFYRPTLDAICEIFGDDRLIYGSNWPVSELYAECGFVQRIYLDYFHTRPKGALEKVFARNAQAAYKWKTRKG